MFLTDIYKSKLGKVPRPEQTLEVGLKLNRVSLLVTDPPCGNQVTR